MQAKLEKEARFEAITYQGITWIDIENCTRKEMNILARDYPFHPLNLDDCLSKIQLTKMEHYDEYLFILLHIPSFDAQGGVVVSHQISVFLGKDYLITLHPGECVPLVDMFQTSKRDEGRRQALMGKSSVHLLYNILDKLVDTLFPILDKVMSDLDDIEDKVFDEKASAAREVSRLRREIADLRRIVFPLRRLVADLATKAQQFTTYDLSVYFSDVKDHIEKVWETLEEAKETIEIYWDTDYIFSVERTSRVLAILTVVFTLSIPATVIGTFYGMNVPLPGSSLSFLGPYTPFLLLLAAAVIPALAMAWYFRRLGWI